MALHLVRHGRPLPRPGAPARDWDLDPAGFDDVWALRESGRLPGHATWFCSPEPKAIQTAQLLTESEVGVLDDLREPGDGEPLGACRERVVAAARRVLDVHAGEDVVLVGHGTAWTLLVAELRGAEPDLDAWERLALPDLVVVEHPR